MLFKILPLLLGAQAVACATEPVAEVSSAVATASDADLDCLSEPTAIIKAVFQEAVRHSPTLAVSAGDRSLDASLDDLGPAEFATFYRRMRKLDQKLAGIDAAALSAAGRYALDLALTTTRDARSRDAARTQLWELSSIADLGDILSSISQVQVLRSGSDLDDLLIRYRKIPAAMEQRQANLRAGLAQGLVASQPVVARVIGNYRDNFGATTGDGSPFADVAFAADISPATQALWKARVAAVVDGVVSPALQRFAGFLETTVLPRARTTFGDAGLGTLGTSYYLAQIKVQTGSDLTPDEIHALGLQRVAEIEAQMTAQLEVLGIHEATLAAGLARLKQQPESVPATAAQASAHAAEVLNKLYGAPWSDAVWGMPNPSAMKVTVVERAGTPFYLIGASTMVIPVGSTTQYELDSMVTHEYTHYLQDLVHGQPGAEPAVSPYLGLFGSVVLVEGEAHFSEVLALGSTLYDYPDARTAALTKLAGLNGLMLRAVRMVVDTGIHTKGWTRDQVIAYMADHLVSNPPFFSFEADRYASWPGQALGYRLGMEAMASEESRAAAALGVRLSSSAFHRMALGLSGATTQLLHQATDDFIASTPQ